MGRAARHRFAMGAWWLTGIGWLALLGWAHWTFRGATDEVPWILFPGRFHPMVVHFPIAAVVLALGFHLVEQGRPNAPGGGALALLWVATLTAMVAVLLGTLLAFGDGYGATLLLRHRWTGIGVAAVVWLALGEKLRAIFGEDGARSAGRRATLLLFVAHAFLLPAAHYGGSLTHGERYLTRYAVDFQIRFFGIATGPENLPAAENALLFDNLVLPILDRHCTTCHGPEKNKGELRLDQHALLLRGGKQGPAAIPGSPRESLLLDRIARPEIDRHVMPPMGRPRLSDRDLEVLRWWIDSGLSADAKMAAAQIPARFLEGAQPGSSPSGSAEDPSSPNLDVLLKTLREQGVTVLPITEAEPRQYRVAAFEVITEFDDEDLARLLPLAPYLVELNLARSYITEDGAARLLPRFTALRVLRLDQTRIGDQTLRAVLALPNLVEVGFHSTQVGDEALSALVDAPSLRVIHLWNTRVTQEGVVSIRPALPSDLIINR